MAAMEEGQCQGVRIAVLDSGIEIGHPDFRGRSLCDDMVVELENFTPGEGEDVYGHGTAIASIIWKLAPQAEIGSFRVLGPNLSARSALVARAAEKAISLGYHILNCSFACGLASHLALYKSWTDQAALKGVQVVAASGSHDFLRPEWPAHFATVLGVDCGAVAGLTHRGGSLIEFVAPGSDVPVAWRDRGHRLMTGSSFAAAHLTGLLGRILAHHDLRDTLLTKALLREVSRTALQSL